MEGISQVARKLFETDQEFGRDRRMWGEFDKMPVGLQQWWMDRASNHVRVQQHLDVDQNGAP